MGRLLTRTRDPQTEAIRRFTAQTGIDVRLVPGPETITDRLAQVQEMLSRHVTSPDVYAIDVIWPDILAQHLLDLRPGLGSAVAAHLPALIANDTVDGRLVAAPFYADVGLLYYRADLLRAYGYRAPPRTWDELQAMALRIQAGERAKGRQDFWGFVWPGVAHEGLTCVALEWQVAEGGGRIVEPDGTISINNPRARYALQRAARWVGMISPPTTPVYFDQDVRNAFESGQAMFMRQWFDPARAAEQVRLSSRGELGVAELPTGSAGRASVLGGWQLAVSKYSRFPNEAVAFVRFMTAEAQQRENAIKQGVPPTLPTLFSDRAVLAANPAFVELRGLYLGGAVARPSKVCLGHYDEVSRAYFDRVNDVLAHRLPAIDALVRIEIDVRRITGFPTARPGGAR